MESRLSCDSKKQTSATKLYSVYVDDDDAPSSHRLSIHQCSQGVQFKASITPNLELAPLSPVNTNIIKGGEKKETNKQRKKEIRTLKEDTSPQQQCT
jgi:hypothetical protein